MNVRKFTARSSREALALVKQAFGPEAIVLSNKPCAEGVEVLAMAPEGMGHIEQLAAAAPRTVARPASPPAPMAPSPRGSFAERARLEPSFGAEVGGDVQQLAMSTLSFQDYVRERMLKRRQAAIQRNEPALAATPEAQLAQRFAEPERVANKPAKVAPRPSTTAVDLAAEPLLTQVVEDPRRPHRRQSWSPEESTLQNSLQAVFSPSPGPGATRQPENAA